MATTETPDDIVGHKTLADGSHTPLRRDEAETIMAAIDAEDAKRKADMPTEQDAIRAMFDGWLRLKDFGWREAIYCPKDGSGFDVIEAGSTGIHRCFYEGEWPDGYYMVGDGMDCGPSRPILFRLDPEAEAARKAKMEAARARYQAEREAEPHDMSEDDPKWQEYLQKRGQQPIPYA